MMDRALKERIIGAAVLVLVVVLVVPVFLDGPPDDSVEMRSASEVPLPGQSEPGTKAPWFSTVTEPSLCPRLMRSSRIETDGCGLEPARPVPQPVVRDQPSSRRPGAGACRQRRSRGSARRQASAAEKPEDGTRRDRSLQPPACGPCNWAVSAIADNAERQAAANCAKQGHAAFLSEVSDGTRRHPASRPHRAAEGPGEQPTAVAVAASQAAGLRGQGPAASLAGRPVSCYGVSRLC